MRTLTLIDETTFGGRGSAWTLELPNRTMLLRDIIKQRVYQEVADINAGKKIQHSRLLVTSPTNPKIDADEQFSLAMKAFHRHRFVVFINDVQVTDEYTEITIDSDTYVTFLQLVPLMGS